MAAADEVRPAGAGDKPVVQRWDTGRVEAFSDGVFAIAITLLVLDIKVTDFEHLRKALANEWPAYLAYVTSFTTVGSVWLAHHNLFSRLRYIDATLLRLNLLLLMATAFLPFPTSVLAEALHTGESAERTAVAFYGAAALVIELLLRRAVLYAESRPDLEFGADTAPTVATEPRPHAKGWRAWVSTALYVMAIVFGVFVFPRIAVIGYLVVGIRSVFVVGSEGRLSFDFRFLVLKRWSRS
ncbi:MAG TPA: TMEM175 family protein [Solirubrobacteraceae bacterium]|nr:TMEM175 family protein [Solirubrobacteraceae bacterium]